MGWPLSLYPGSSQTCPQVREVLCNVIDRGRVQHACDTAVGEQQDAVGIRGCHRIVGDHHDRVPFAIHELSQQPEDALPVERPRDATQR